MYNHKLHLRVDVMLAALVVGVHDRLQRCQLRGNHRKHSQRTKAFQCTSYL